MIIVKIGDNMKNPYLLQFGKEPEEYISRLEQKETVINSLLNDEMQMHKKMQSSEE